MNKKSFFIGIVVGVILSVATVCIVGLINKNKNEDPVKYLETPVSYEDKTEASFQIFQVLGNAALASESSEFGMYLGNTVLILGENFYDDQIVMIKNPQRVGTYSYTNNGGMYKTVPVLDGDMGE